AAIGLPPEATMPTKMNCDAPANTSSDSSIGSQIGSPEVTAIAPNDIPTMPSARQTSAMSRTSSWSSPEGRIRHIERIAFYNERNTRVRQREHPYRWSEQMALEPAGAPLDVIAASLRRERDRAG